MKKKRNHFTRLPFVSQRFAATSRRPTWDPYFTLGEPCKNDERVLLPAEEWWISSIGGVMWGPESDEARVVDAEVAMERAIILDHFV